MFAARVVSTVEHPRAVQTAVATAAKEGTSDIGEALGKIPKPVDFVPLRVIRRRAEGTNATETEKRNHTTQPPEAVT